MHVGDVGGLPPTLCGLERAFLPEACKLAWNKTDKVKLLLIEKLEL